MRQLLRSPIFLLLLVIMAIFVVPSMLMRGSSSSERDLTFLQFEQLVEEQQVQGPVVVKTRDMIVEGRLKNGESFKAGFTQDVEISQVLTSNQLDFRTDPQTQSPWLSLLFTLGPILLIILFFMMMMGRSQAGGNQLMGFGRSRAKRMNLEQARVTFKDVAGADEAVEELQEIKEFLENPARFRGLGAKIPTGVLLYGPPGTGKTLLARAVAGEAGVPFFSISGSDFVEMFVGVGASRVRDLFEQAKANQPCIVFIDEIDAVGRQRGAGLGGGHDEREQTLNQLLVEMDGFESNDSIIVMAGTNRPDILDPALLRPGRFDRQIMVDRPDKAGRQAILEVHSRGKPLASDIDLGTLAAQTPGFTGADLANLMNEAALLSARGRHKTISMEELEEAIMRVMTGPEKKSRLLTQQERLITAYHEGGHALVAHFLPKADPVHKVSIISRGQALGYTITLPTDDKFMVEKDEIMDRLAHMLGGRAAEEIRFESITTGAANDLQKATETARKMIMQYGMSESLGPRTFGHDPSQPFMGREMGGSPDYSEDTARKIDAEIWRVIDEAHVTATRILNEHRERLDLLATVLLDRETVDKQEFEALMRGESPEDVFAERDRKDRERPRRRTWWSRESAVSGGHSEPAPDASAPSPAPAAKASAVPPESCGPDPGMDKVA